MSGACVRCEISSDQDYCQVCVSNAKVLITDLCGRYCGGKRVSSKLFALFAEIYKTSWFVTKHFQGQELRLKCTSLNTDLSAFRNSQYSSLRTFASQRSLAEEELEEDEEDESDASSSLYSSIRSADSRGTNTSITPPNSFVSLQGMSTWFPEGAESTQSGVTPTNVNRVDPERLVRQVSEKLKENVGEDQGLSMHEIDDLFNMEENGMEESCDFPFVDSSRPGSVRDIGVSRGQPRSASTRSQQQVPDDTFNQDLVVRREISVVPELPQFPRSKKFSLPNNHPLPVVKPSQTNLTVPKKKHSEPGLLKTVFGLFKSKPDNGMLEPDYVLETVIKLYFKCYLKLGHPSMKKGESMDVKRELIWKLGHLRSHLDKRDNDSELSFAFNFVLILVGKLFERFLSKSEQTALKKVGHYFNRKWIDSAFRLRNFQKRRNAVYDRLIQVIDDAFS